MAKERISKTTRTKRGRSNQPNLVDHPDAGGPDSPNAGEVVDSEYLNDWGEFFDDTGVVQVALYRVLPSQYQGIDISGFLEYLSPGTDLGYIKGRYGGGKYRVQARDTSSGRFVQQGYVKIAGLPVVDSPPKPPESAPTDSAGNPDRVSPMLNIGDMTVPADLRVIKEVLLFQRLVDTLMPAKVDPNVDIMTLLLKERSGSGLGSVTEAVELIGRIKDILPAGGEGEGGWTGIAAQGLATLRSFIERQPPGGPPSKRPLLPGVAPGQPAGQPTVNQPAGQPAQPQTGPPEMGTQSLVEKACVYLVNGYLAEHKPDQIATTIQAVLPPMDDGVKAQLAASRSILLSVAETMLVDQVEVDQEERDKFRLTFDAVLDTLTSTQSQPPEGKPES